MTNVVIAGYNRSAFTLASKGALRQTRPDDIAAAVVKGLLEKTKVKPEDVEDLALGCVFSRSGARPKHRAQRCVSGRASRQCGGSDHQPLLRLIHAGYSPGRWRHKAGSRRHFHMRRD